jgi:hypothetical protein
MVNPSVVPLNPTRVNSRNVPNRSTFGFWYTVPPCRRFCRAACPVEVGATLAAIVYLPCEDNATLRSRNAMAILGMLSPLLAPYILAKSDPNRKHHRSGACQCDQGDQNPRRPNPVVKPDPGGRQDRH